MGKTAKKRWTEAEVAKLKSMAGNYPVEQIAQEIGRGISATVMKAHDLRVSLRMHPKPERPATFTMLSQARWYRF
jgi:hypothetical protein